MCKKTALVTGSARGIGYAIAERLGKEGFFVIVSDVISPEDARHTLSRLNSAGIDCDYIKCDISDSDDRESLMNAVCTRYGRLDVLVNNAGVAPLSRFDILQTTTESFDRLMDINLKGTFFMCQKCADMMIKMQKNDLTDFFPRIVNIASISSYTSSVNRGEYCISKAGISMTTALFADRLAEHNIPVFEVRPGIILTDMTEKVKDKYSQMISDGLTPIKRFGTPSDVADCVWAACSRLLDFSTGQVLNADGGFHLRRL